MQQQAKKQQDQDGVSKAKMLLLKLTDPGRQRPSVETLSKERKEELMLKLWPYSIEQ